MSGLSSTGGGGGGTLQGWARPAWSRSWDTCGCILHEQEGHVWGGSPCAKAGSRVDAWGCPWGERSLAALRGVASGEVEEASGAQTGRVEGGAQTGEEVPSAEPRGR